MNDFYELEQQIERDNDLVKSFVSGLIIAGMLMLGVWAFFQGLAEWVVR